jgi:hypothetical protein
MTKENRANLIFACLFIAVIIPGAVMLVKKQMKPGSTPVGGRDVVHRQTAYMDPLPLPGFERQVPPGVRKWVGAIASTQPTTQPVISHSRTFEVTSLEKTATGWDAMIVIWNTRVALPNALTSTIRVDDKDLPGELTDSRRVDLPREVDQELRDVGFVNPPDHVLVARFHYPGATARPSSITLLGEPAELRE